MPKSSAASTHERPPRKATTWERVIALKRDNLSAGDYWILVECDSVTIAHQIQGEHAQTMLVVPRREFNRLIDFYNGGRP